MVIIDMISVVPIWAGVHQEYRTLRLAKLVNIVFLSYSKIYLVICISSLVELTKAFDYLPIKIETLDILQLQRETEK